MHGRSDPRASPSFLEGGGEMGALMRAHDWAATPLGPPETWPQALRTAVRLILNTGHPMYVWWGPELLCFYNDAYRASIGPERHPGSLGQPGREVWDEIWPIIGPQIEQVLRGDGATWHENALVPITRNSRLEDVYWTYSYGPIDDEAAPNGVGGVLVVCTETTQQVLAEHRARTERERLGQMFEQAPGFMALLEGSEHRFALANAAYRKLIGGRDVIGQTVREALPDVEGQGFFELLDQVYATGEPFQGTATPLRLARKAGQPSEERVVDFIYQPLTSAQGQVTAVFVEGSDITERKAAEEALRHTAAAASYRATLSDALRPLARPSEIQAEALRVLGDHLGASRAHYAEVEPDGVHAVVPDDYATTVPNRAGRYSLAAFPTLTAELRAGRNVAVPNIPADPSLTKAEKAIYAALPVAAIAAVSLVKEGRLVAILAVHFDAPHVWNSDEVALIEETAERTWFAIEQARSERELRESEARFRLMADSVPQIVWITDAEGRNEFFNRRWFDYTGALREPTTAAKVTTTHIHPDDRAPTIAAFEEARRTGRRYRTEHRIRSVAGEYRWFLVRGEPYRDPSSGEITHWFGASVDIHDRKLAEEALQESEEQLRLATEAAEVGFWDVDPLQDELVWPARVKAMFGISPDQPVSMRDFYAGLHPDDRQSTTEAFAAAMDPSRRALYDVEYRTVGKEDGVIRWVAAKGRGVFDGEGRCVRLIGTALDITARKSVDEELRELNATLEARVAEQSAERDRIWRMSRDLLAVMGFDGYLKSINPAWERTLGLDTATLLARPFGEQVHPQDHASIMELMERLKRGETVERFEDRLRHADGSWRWIAWTLVPEGDVFYAVGRDVTEEKRRAEALRLYENIVQSDRFPICAYDTEMRVIAFNKAHYDEFFRILGHRQQVGDLFPDLFPPDQAPIVRAFTERALRGETFTIAGEFGDPDHEKPAWESDYAPLRDEEGYIIGAFHHARDVSPRLRAEEELRAAQDALRQSQKMEAVGQLTGGVAHDFNNLLTIIRSSTSLLRRPDLPEKRRQVYMDAIGETVDRAARLTGQLLAFARRQSLKPELFDVVEKVRGLEGLLRTVTDERIDLQIEASCKNCFAQADVSQFETALVNMAVNARDAIAGEGALTVRVETVDAKPAFRGEKRQAGRFVAVSLTDTGAGIAPEHLEQIFEPFFTTKEVGKGTGLGLSQVYGFAKQSGGDVAVVSRPGQGSTFTLYLPRVEPPEAGAVAANQPATVTLVGGQGRRILVVEDNAEVGTFATQLLQDLGYETTWAMNGNDALAQLETATTPFDIVFSDVVMPGMSGLELGEKIRHRYPGLPVLLTSGYSHTLAEEGRHGFELLRKPYTVEELSRVLAQVSQGRRTT